jgi:hypothetical protein
MAKKKTEGLIVSQSMIKDVRKYLKREMCGLVLHSKYITKTYPYDAEDSPAKKLGRYFEYILTGAVPKSGTIPEPEYMKTPLAKKKREELTVEDMYEPYRTAHMNAARVKNYFKMMDITILEAGVVYTKGLIDGTIDVIALYKGERIVIDIKYSGLIHDRWNEYGWMWTPEQKKNHGTQAIHYNTLTKLPFYFLVVSSTNIKDILFHNIVVDDLDREQHQRDIDDTRSKMLTYTNIGFNPIPDLVRCSECALRNSCESRQDYPAVKRIHLGDED